MNTPGLTKSFIAAAAIGAFKPVRFGAGGAVQQAGTATDAVIGVSTDIAAAVGERVDVVLSGIAYVEAAAGIALGDLVTAGGGARATLAAPAAGSNVRVLGVAMEASSAAGDVIAVLLTQGSMQG